MVEEFGGQPTPAVGFATGLERVMEMYTANNEIKDDKIPDLYILSVGKEENIKAINLAEELRKEKFIIEKDVFERSFKAQMKYADKINARFLLVIGEEEIKTQMAKIKNMKTGEEKEVKLTLNEIRNIIK